MTWAQTNLLKTVLLPPFNLLFIQAIGLMLWWTRKRFLAYALVAVPWIVWVLISCPSTASWLIQPIQNSSPPLNLEDPSLIDQAQAIVVLGAGRYFSAPEYGGHDTVPVFGLERLRYAAQLYRKVKKPILVSGGTPDGPGRSEAAIMTDSLEEDFETPVQWKEEKSDNTEQSARKSFDILNAAGIRKVFLVTHASHMLRAKQAFESAGFDVVAAPMGFEHVSFGYAPLRWIPRQEALVIGYTAIHETIGTIWYSLKRKLGH